MVTFQSRRNTDRKNEEVFRYHHTKPTSYADALTRNIRRPVYQRTANTIANYRSSSSSVHIEVAPEDTLWLKDAWVGRLKNQALFERLEDEFRWGMGLEIVPRYMGDDQVLLLGLTDADADKLINGGTTGESMMFSSIERWNPSLRAGNRLTWIHCWGIPIQAWNQKYISQIVAVMGELMDLDDSAEEKRRMDRARVLIKTPWKPIIQHTVEVTIGEDKFTIQIVEECCGGCQDGFRSGRNVRGSSEDINSDDSFLDSSSFANWGFGDDASIVPESDFRSAHTSTAATTANGAGNHGEQQPPLLHASELHIASPGAVAENDVGVEDQQSPTASNGPSDNGYPLDNVNNHRVDSGNQWVNTHGPNSNFMQATVTYNPEDSAKRRAMKWEPVPNIDDTLQSYHQLGNEAQGESSGLETGQKMDIAVGGDVERINDSLMTRGTGEYKEVEAIIVDTEARAILTDQNSNSTPSDKRSKLGLNPLTGGGATSCQVYSRQRRCKKKITSGLIPLGSGDETHKGLSQPPNTQPSSLHNEPYNDKLETPFQLQVYNGNMEATSDSDKTFNPDALQMWSMAKQLGLTGEGSKESVIQKFQNMEERDRAEATRRVSATAINENNLL